MNFVLIVGSALESTLESSYARAFKQLGWSVGFWEPLSAMSRAARGSKLGQRVSSLVNIESWQRKANVELVQRALELRPDLILVIATTGVRAGTLAQLKVLLDGILIYCIFPDSPHYLEAERINCLRFFDRVTASSPAWTSAFERLGAERVHYLPFAADTTIHYPANNNGFDRTQAHDLVFIGNWRPEREALLEHLCDLDLFIWGTNYWKTRTRPGSDLRVRWGGRAVTGTELGIVCAQSKILLNIMDSITWPGPNMRVFEQPACRAFSLATRSPAITEMFREGENIECFETEEEARDKISFYLKNEESRNRIANASYEFVVRGGHTYIDRATQLIAWSLEDKHGSPRTRSVRA